MVLYGEIHQCAGIHPPGFISSALRYRPCAGSLAVQVIRRPRIRGDHVLMKRLPAVVLAILLDRRFQLRDLFFVLGSRHPIASYSKKVIS
jgi:hypothetical protein